MRQRQVWKTSLVPSVGIIIQCNNDTAHNRVMTVAAKRYLFNSNSCDKRLVGFLQGLGLFIHHLTHLLTLLLTTKLLFLAQTAETLPHMPQKSSTLARLEIR